MWVTQLDCMINFCKCFDIDKLAVIVIFQLLITINFFPLSSLLADTCMKFVMLQKFCVQGTI